MLDVPDFWRLLWLYLFWQQPDWPLFSLCPSVRTIFSLSSTSYNPCGGIPVGRGGGLRGCEVAAVQGKLSVACFVTMMDNFTSWRIVCSWVILEVPVKPVCNLPASVSLIVPLTEQLAFVKRRDSLRSHRTWGWDEGYKMHYCVSLPRFLCVFLLFLIS